MTWKSEPGVNSGDRSATVIVVSGVSGAGKSTVGRVLADHLGWPFAEGDDLHPAANIAKMRRGEPLDDHDRVPWLDAVAAWIGARATAAEPGVITCSALRRAYRDRLRVAHPHLWFVHLAPAPEVLGARLATRAGHFMPPDLLASQLGLVESLESDEPGVMMSSGGALVEVVADILRAMPVR